MTLAQASPADFARPARRCIRIERLTGLGFALPAFVLLLLTMLLPLAVLLWLSLTNYEFGGVDMDWVGLANFQKALADPIIRRSLVNTLLYVAIVVPGGVLGALLIAVLVHRRTRTRSFYEVVYFLPVTSTLIAMATVWQFLLHPSLGPVNGLLKGLGIGPVAFRRMIPPLGNQFIVSLKDTSLFIVIGVGELTRQGQEIMAANFRAVEIWSAVAILYLLMTGTLTLILRVTEKRMLIL